jgi:hypothetical protein
LTGEKIHFICLAPSLPSLKKTGVIAKDNTRKNCRGNSRGEITKIFLTGKFRFVIIKYPVVKYWG